jgi:glycerophosphoryl diester phosphodiesterase
VGAVREGAGHARSPFLDNGGRPIALAHRGGAAGGLENSLAAFGRAWELGYRWFETDARLTADGVLVALHDPTLDRVTDRGGAVAELPWREVRAARIAGREPVPTIEEVLAGWPEARVVVELKVDEAVEPVVEVVRRLGAVERVCVGSFSDRRLARVRAALGPALCTSMGPNEVRRLRAAAWRLLPRAAVPRAAACVQVPARWGRVPLAEPRLLALAHALGLPVQVWTVNRPGEMRRLLDLGVDGILSDELPALRAVLEERGAWRSP